MYRWKAYRPRCSACRQQRRLCELPVGSEGAALCRPIREWIAHGNLQLGHAELNRPPLPRRSAQALTHPFECHTRVGVRCKADVRCTDRHRKGLRGRCDGATRERREERTCVSVSSPSSSSSAPARILSIANSGCTPASSFQFISPIHTTCAKSVCTSKLCPPPPPRRLSAFSEPVAILFCARELLLQFKNDYELGRQENSHRWPKARGCGLRRALPSRTAQSASRTRHPSPFLPTGGS